MSRNKSIDVMKGIGIFLVVFAHTMKDNIFIPLIYIFHMPLFFIISGYLIKFEHSKLFIEFVKKKNKGIILPYFIFALLSFLYWITVECKFRSEIATDISGKSIFLNIFFMKVDSNLLLPNVVLWFLPCLYFSSILFYFIKKINIKSIRIIVSLFLYIIGYVLIINNIILPFAIETVLVILIFIDIGFELSKEDRRMNYVLIFIFSIILYLLSAAINSNVNILEHHLENPILFVTGALGGTGVIYIIAQNIQKLKFLSNAIQYIGINSLTIMLVHEPLKRIIIFATSKILNIEIYILRNNLFFCFIITIIIIVITIPIIIFINKYIPWIIGKNKKNKLLKSNL